MRVLITGVSGYAGFYAALRLAAAGHEVTGLTRHPEQRRLALLRMHEVALTTGDTSRPESYRDVLERSDLVIHTMLDKKQPRETDRALFGAIAALPKRVRFIYTTGCSIFGKIGVPLMDESAEPHPDHPLGFRRGLELEALALENAGVTVLRPGFMFGNDGYNSVSTDWFAMAETGDVVYRGDREKGWSWIHIDDLADAYLRVVEAGPAVEGEVYFLADEQRPQCVDVMRACVAAAGYAGEVGFGPPLHGQNTSTWFDQNEFISSAKARRQLGWSPRHPGIMAGIPAAYAAWKTAQSL
jgi:nucleoside-diphosphate-sugar epimerase